MLIDMKRNHPSYVRRVGRRRRRAVLVPAVPSSSLDGTRPRPHVVHVGRSQAPTPHEAALVASHTGLIGSRQPKHASGPLDPIMQHRPIAKDATTNLVASSATGPGCR